MSDDKHLTLTVIEWDGPNNPFEIPNSGGKLIWTLKTDQGIKKTMSKKVANSLNETIDVIEYENRSGNKYIKMDRDAGGYASAPSSGGSGSGDSSHDTGIEVGHAINNAVQLEIASSSKNDHDISMNGIHQWAKQILTLSDKMKAERSNQGTQASQTPQEASKPDVPPWGGPGANEAPPAKPQTPESILEAAGYNDRIDAAGMPDGHIRAVYDAVNGEAIEFLEAIDGQLTAKGY